MSWEDVVFRLNQSFVFISHHYTFSCLLALIILSFDYFGKVDFVKPILDRATAPIMQTVDQSLQKSNQLYLIFCKAAQLYQDNQALRKQELVSAHQLKSYGILQKEHQTLLTLLRHTQHLTHHTVSVVRPFKVNRSKNCSEYLVCNADIHHLIKVGQIVVSAQGVVGKVIQTGPKTSKILCVNDARSSVPIETVHGVRGILMGQGPLRPLKLAFVTKTDDVQMGETLMTSGLGGYYPKGYPIARVTAVLENSINSYLTIHATPIATLDENQYLLILKC